MREEKFSDLPSKKTRLLRAESLFIGNIAPDYLVARSLVMTK